MESIRVLLYPTTETKGHRKYQMSTAAQSHQQLSTKSIFKQVKQNKGNLTMSRIRNSKCSVSSTLINELFHQARWLWPLTIVSLCRPFEHIHSTCILATRRYRVMQSKNQNVMICEVGSIRRHLFLARNEGFIIRPRMVEAKLIAPDAHPTCSSAAMKFE